MRGGIMGVEEKNFVDGEHALIRHSSGGTIVLRSRAWPRERTRWCLPG